MSSGQYEFTKDQNAVIDSLASKMSLVGLFLVLVGVIQIIMALLVVGAIYQDKIPADWVTKSKDLIDKVSPELREKAEAITPDKLPPRNYLWGIALNLGVIGLFFAMMGTWTRSSSKSFKQIVTSKGQDLTHLMNALSSMLSMYSLIYTLLVVTILCGVVFLGLNLYQRYVA